MWEQVDPDVISCNPGPLFRWVMTLSPVSWRLYRSSSQDFYKYLPDVCLMRLLLAPGWWWCWWYLWVIESYCPVPRDVHSPQSWPQHITAPRGSRTIQRGHHILFHFDDEYVFTNRQCQVKSFSQFDKSLELGRRGINLYLSWIRERPIAINSNYVWHKAAPSSGLSSPFIAFFSHADSRSWAEQAEAPLCSSPPARWTVVISTQHYRSVHATIPVKW